MMTRTHSRRLPILLAAIAALALLFSTVEAQQGAAPGAPTGLTTAPSPHQVALTWDDPNDASITGYVILRRDKAIHAQGVFETVAPDTGTAATTYTDAAVEPAKRYVYRIKAINAHGVSEISRWARGYTPAAPAKAPGQAPPAQPTGLTTAPSHDQVVLTWDDPGDAAVTGYVILRRDKDLQAQGVFQTLSAGTGSAAATYTDATAAPEKQYVYRIKAISAHGPSAISNWARGYTPAAPQATLVAGDDPGGQDDPGGAPGQGTPGGPGGRANVSEGDGEDLPTDDTTTGEVDVGGSVTGNIGSGTDGDWFKVVLEAGTRYQIDLEGADTSRGTLPDPRMSLYYSNAVVGPLSNDEGVGKNARRIYTPDAAGDYYVRAQNVNGSDTGTYTLSVILLGANGLSEADTDFPGTTATTGRVDVGASVTGNRGSIGDTDWFAVVLEAGKTYQIDQKGEYGGGGTLEDPYLDNIRDSSGTRISSTFNDDVDFANDNVDSQIIFTPTAAGTYYLVAFASGLITGTYTLSVRDITPPCTLNTGDIWCGVVTVAEVKTTADALVGHGFADGAGLSAGSLAGNPDATMFSVGDNDYTISAAYIQVPTGSTETGALFVLLSADLTDDDKAGLVLTVDDTTITFAFSGATKGTTGLYSWGLSGLTWSAGDTVTVRLSPPPPDDFPADTTTTGQVDVGGSVTGNMDSVFDIDWFRVDLKKDKRYQIDLEGADTNRGTLTDPVLSRMRDALGNVVTDALDSGIGNNARRIFTAPADGIHYVVAASNGVTGTYTLSVIVLGANGASEADTDFPATTATTGRVEVGIEVEASATGYINPATDIDGFLVDLQAGKTYQIDMEGSPTGRGTLADPGLNLYDDSSSSPNSSSFIASDNDGGEGYNSRLTFRSSATGTYLLTVEDNSGSPGTYTLSVRDITPPPDDSDDPPADSTNVSEPDGEDLPEGITTTGRVEVGGSVTGEIAPALDVDWFAVELKKGTRYQFDVEGADTGRGNLADPHLWGLQDAEGQAVSGARSNDGGVGKNGRVINTPDADGTYYIAVAGAVSTTGTYTLSVIVLGANGVSEADTDFPRDTTTTGRVEVGASATGNIDPGEDLDGFRVDLEAGKRYRFDLEGADTGRGSQADPILALYGDSFNVSHYIDEDDDGGEGLNSRLTYTATATGIYHLEVAGLDPGAYTLSVREILLAVAVPPGGLGPSEIPGAVRNVSVSYSPVSGIGGQSVWWDAPDETGTGAQWITEFRIYGSVSEGCGGYLLDEYEVAHPGSTTPPEINGVPTGFKYFKIVYVGPVKFGVAAVNELGEGPCVEGPEPPPPPDSP